MARPAAPPQTGATGLTLQQTAKVGERAWDKSEKVSGELFALTYGTMVSNLVEEQAAASPAATVADRLAKVNVQLEGIGVRIGQRMIDEFLAKSGAPPCKSFLSTSETIAKIGLKMFLNVSAQVDSVVTAEDSQAYSLLFEENPLNGYAELPDGAVKQHLWYSNVLCGVIRGALEQVGIKTKCVFVRDTLRGDPVNEIRVTRVAPPKAK